MNKITNYLTGAITEIKKVVWPSKKQTTNYTILVIGMSIAIALFLGMLDYIFSLGLAQIIK